MRKSTLRFFDARILQLQQLRWRGIPPDRALYAQSHRSNFSSLWLVRAFTWMIILLLILSSGASAQAPRGAADGAAVRAAYVFNFGKYIDWPTTGDTEHLRVCTVETSPVTPILSKANGKKAQGREVQIIPFGTNQLDATLDTGNCNIVYVGECEEFCSKLLEKVEKKPILTVSERKGLGIVQFVDTTSSVGFTINKAALDGSGIKMSSQVLDLAVKE